MVVGNRSLWLRVTTALAKHTARQVAWKLSFPVPYISPLSLAFKVNCDICVVLAQYSDTLLREALQDSHRLLCTEVIARHTYPFKKSHFDCMRAIEAIELISNPLHVLE